MTDFGEFVWAVITNWANLVTGGVIVAFVSLWALLKGQPSKKFSLSLIGIFLFFAFFNAWEDEHKKVLNQVTYIQVNENGVRPSHVEYIEGVWPYVTYTQVNNGDYPALNVVVSIGMELYTFPKPIDPDTFDGDPTIEAIVWKHVRHYRMVGQTFRFSLSECSVQRRRDERMLVSVTWTDGSGPHELQRCEFVLQPPQGNTLVANDCTTHVGLQKKPSA